ncbi:MAG: sigma-54-dependent Fis family transcriptional regulator [Nitrospinae bacterium]|nr:sigma-54-dependent Fis family transcriptional regulator [Nitrospinota bacterium]
MKKPNLLILAKRTHAHPYFQRLSSTYQVKVIESPRDIARVGLFEEGKPSLVIVDASQLPSEEGLSLAKHARHVHRKIPILLIAGESSEELFLAMLRAGINDFVKNPCDFEVLQSSIDRCLSSCSTLDEGIEPPPIFPNDMEHFLVGNSLAIQELRAYMGRVAMTDSHVLITGETGTGKELVARLIHEHSMRRRKPFMCVNCAAVPETLLESELFGYDRGAFTGAVGARRGKLELAQGGTILFDEIGEMSSSAQAKILRAIEEGTIYRLGGKEEVSLNVRIMAATNQDLDRAMPEGKFRQDLYYRLNVARIHLPPLRDRKEDLPLLLRHYIQEFNQKFKRQVEGLTQEALDFLVQYTWPGNIRELKNLLEATFINLPQRTISLIDLPVQFRAKAKECEKLPQAEGDRMLSALLATNWNRSKAAEKLHWSRMTLYRKMQKYRVSIISQVQSINEGSLGKGPVTHNQNMYQNVTGSLVH